jgi:hypothetical protein
MTVEDEAGYEFGLRKSRNKQFHSHSRDSPLAQVPRRKYPSPEDLKLARNFLGIDIR